MKNYIIVILSIACIVLGYLCLSNRTETGVQSTMYNEAVDILQNHVDSVELKNIALEEKLEISYISIRTIDKRSQEKDSMYQVILKRGPRTVIIRDTVEYIQDCERVKEQLVNRLEKIDILENRSLIYEDIVNNQVFLISNLKSQLKRTNEILAHKDSIIDLHIAENRKLKRQRNIVLIGGGVAVVLGILK